MSEQTISLIIPTYNRLYQLQRALSVLPLQTRMPDELILIDDNSTDGLWEWLRWTEPFLPCKRVVLMRVERDHRKSRWKSGWLNPALLFNIGMRRAEGDLVLCSHSEIILQRDVIAQLFAAFHEFPKHIITPSVFYMLKEYSIHPGRIDSKFAQQLAHNPTLLDVPENNYLIQKRWVDRPGLCVFLADREWVVQTRGFDEAWPGSYQCDYDWQWRLEHIGIRRRMVAEAVVVHLWHDEAHRRYDQDSMSSQGWERSHRRKRDKRIIHVNDPNWGLAEARGVSAMYRVRLQGDILSKLGATFGSFWYGNRPVEPL